jgi:hypothetical protein
MVLLPQGRRLHDSPASSEQGLLQDFGRVNPKLSLQLAAIPRESYATLPQSGLQEVLDSLTPTA